MEKIYSGKAKDLFKAEDNNQVIVFFKNSATAGNGVKKAEIDGKGRLNNEITSLIFKYFSDNGVENHFIKKIDERHQLCKKVSIIPLEVIIRNISAGSFSVRYGVKEGVVFKRPTFELSYKKDELGDPLLNKDHAIALEIINEEEYSYIKNESYKINDLLIKLFNKMNIDLVDFKIEFGKLPNGKIILADEFSPDNARLWDKESKRKLDKDNFRRDIGNLTEAYEVILKGLKNVL